MFGDHSELDPPDPIPNSEVKRFSADGSVGSPHVRVGHRQAFIRRILRYLVLGDFFCLCLAYISILAYILLNERRLKCRTKSVLTAGYVIVL